MPQSFIPSSRHVTSPPPSSVPSTDSSDEESPEDPFSAGSDGTAGSTEDKGKRQNTLSSSKNSSIDASASSAVPANPFAKTLANLETESKPSDLGLGVEQHSAGVDLSKSRPHYDVDDFKRLLLTGEKSGPGITTSAAPPVSFQSQHSLGDSSSNTDASSLSRQSIFEPATGPLQGSPETSLEASPLDDDRQKLVGDLPSSLPKPKPSTPKHRHGKLVKTNAPQTVSFEDPSLSIASSDVTPKSPATLGNFDKPLPALPPSSSISESLILSEDTTKQDFTSTTGYIPFASSTQKPNPPEPPLSRRQSKLKPKPLATAEQVTPVPDQVTTAPSALSQSPPATTPKVPPPPPPRRTGGLMRVNSSSSTSTTASFPPTQSQSSVDDMAPKSRPPALPNHSPNLSAVKRQQNQPFSGSSAVAPPPPPRRRGSSQSSYTPSRLSGDYRTAGSERLRSDSGASSVSYLPTPSSSESKDVMADLSALQREVDELRGKFRD